MLIKGLNFLETSIACPEQYDVEDSNGNIVGYVRLRWGCLTCDVPDCGGDTIYSYYFDDGWMGCFKDDEQRKHHLNIIADKINEYYAELDEIEYQRKLDECYKKMKGMEEFTDL